MSLSTLGTIIPDSFATEAHAFNDWYCHIGPTSVLISDPCHEAFKLLPRDFTEARNQPALFLHLSDLITKEYNKAIPTLC